jgi:hypothetical protein
MRKNQGNQENHINPDNLGNLGNLTENVVPTFFIFSPKKYL